MGRESVTSQQRSASSRQLQHWRLLTDSWLLVVFWPLTALVLFCDSLAVRSAGLPGQLFSNLLAPLFLLVLLPHLSSEQRRSVIIFVPFSALGEGLFSLVFGLYTYAEGGVPFYVPFGHAILLAICFMIADRPVVVARTSQIRWALIAFHSALIGGAWLALGDSLSALFGLLFVLIMIRKRGRVLYLIMGVLVLYIELLGTAFGCWYWWPQPWGVLHTLNPPVGAFACYVVADLIVMRLGRTFWRVSK